MAKTITIPTGFGSRVIVVLNGVKYIYEAGETVSVPDEVAALFENNASEAVIYGRRAAAPLEAPVRKEEEGVELVTDDDGNLYLPVRMEDHVLVIGEE